MSSIGDIIPELCTASPLLSTTTWESAQIQLGQWNSLSVLVYCDTNCTLKVHWAAAGIYYDYIETYSITSNTPIQISLVTVNKWVYFTLDNLGSNQSVLRLNTYGTVTNNAVQVRFPNTVTVGVSNQPLDFQGNFSTVGLNPFQDAQINLRNVTPNAESLFSDVPNYQFMFQPLMKVYVTDPTISYFETDNCMVQLKGFDVVDGTDVGKMARVYSNSVTPVVVDKTMLVSITAAFNDDDQSANTYYSDEQVGFGLYTSESSTTWYNGFSIGKGEPALWGTVYTKFRIRRWDNGVSSTVTQNNFNMDKLNGTGASGMILDTTKMNNYMIKFRVGGTIQALFSVLNPATGNYVEFHKTVIANAYAITGKITGCRMIIDSVNQSSVPTLADVAGSSVSSFCSYIESGSVIQPGYPVSWGSSVSTGTAETQVVLLYNNESFLSIHSAIPCVVSDLSFSSDTTSSLTVRLYKNATMTVGSLSDLNTNFTPLQFVSSFTVTDKGVLVGTYSIGGNDSFFKDIRGIILNPGENLMITGQLTSGSSSNCNYSLSFLQYI